MTISEFKRSSGEESLKQLQEERFRVKPLGYKLKGKQDLINQILANIFKYDLCRTSIIVRRWQTKEFNHMS